MHDETLKQVARELQLLLPGRFVGRIFQLTNYSLAIDFGLKDKRFLFVSIDPASPRLYLIKRTTRELEKASQPLLAFAQALRSILAGGNLTLITKDENERLVRFSFQTADEPGNSSEVVLVAQLTGRSSNLYLLNSLGTITHAWRTPQGVGQQVGQVYKPPTAASSKRGVATENLLRATSESQSISELVDSHYRQLIAEETFQTATTKLQTKLRQEIARRKKLKANLEKDLVAHGSPDQHKRLGDLLLANLTSANRRGNKVKLTDYYAEGTPTIEIEVDENTTLQEAATEYFSRYTKAKRAVEEIAKRQSQVEKELEQLTERKLLLEAAIASRDQTALAGFEEPKAAQPGRGKKEKATPSLPGMRRYRSSDGYEVLVGRTARDNDQLTFRVARPNDLWLHAGDYPGSHVIIRNSARQDIPHRTIIEAAQLAAKFSQASKDTKVAIHYTRRKFLSKPKGAAPGLVRLSSFKTITVEPGENLERIK